MVQRCLDADSKFGVVLIKSGDEVGEPAEPHSVGTSARILKVDRIDDGRMLLNVRGEERFRIAEITQLRPYLEARVDFLTDEPDPEVAPAEMQAVREAVTGHTRLAMGLKGGWVRETRMPKDPAALSYFIGTLLQSDPAEKQAVLEEDSTSRRLSKELELLQREAAVLRQRLAEHLKKRIFTS